MTVKYKPKNVRELLTEMKDTSDIMIDLSYAVLLFNNKELAKHVRELESKMDALMYQIRVIAAAAARNVEEAKKITGILQVASAAEAISDATGDIVDLVLRGMKIHPVLQEAITTADEKLVEVCVTDDSKMVSKKLRELRLPSNIGVWILALKRGDTWIIPPTKDTEIMARDTLVAKGPIDGIKTLCEMTGTCYEPKPVKTKLAGIMASLAEMRDMSVMMVDLAYSSILLGLHEIAEEVRELEEKFDKLNYKLWLDTLKAAALERDIEGLNSVLQVVKCMEKISDAADSIADVMLRGLELHPVFADAIALADEKITKVDIPAGSVFENRTLKELNLWATMGAYVLMIKRGEHYIFDPSKDVKIHAGDLLVIRGPYAGVEKVKSVASCTHNSGE